MLYCVYTPSERIAYTLLLFSHIISMYYYIYIYILGHSIVGARWAGVRRSSGPGSGATDLSSMYIQAIVY